MPVQRLVQLPQWFLSLAVSMQTLPQSEKPALHCTAHLLARHTAVALAPAGHILAQTPQLVGSLVVSTQTPEHSMAGDVHTKSQTPPTQVGLAFGTGSHTLSQAPQLLVSPPVSTQEPSQSVRPPPQVDVHVPLSQTCEPEQTLPQILQLFLSVFRLTHWLLQSE